MSKKETYNEPLKEETDVKDPSSNPATEAENDANVAEQTNLETDTMADQKPTPEQQVLEWKDKYIRLQAEFDNYRKRTLREKMDLVETGGQDVLKAILPVVDDVERAVDAMSKSDDVDSLRKGVELIAQKFTETLKQKRVVAIEAKGEPFDEEWMEAVAKFPAGEEQRGKVIDVVQTGYKLGERVLRFAKVVVGE